MKNLLKLALALVVSFSLVNCEEDAPGGSSNSIGFEDSSASIAVDIGSETEEVIFVYAGNTTGSDRIILVSVNAEGTTADPTVYEVPSQVVIPAGENVGQMPVFVRDLGNTDGTAVVVDIIDAGGAFLIADQITINLSTVCPEATPNDTLLNITYDDFPGETSWEMYLEGELIDSGAWDGSSATFSRRWCLPGGNYTFVIYDAFGDGICCDYGEGSYSLFANGSEVVSGGDFGSSESTDFTLP